MTNNELSVSQPRSKTKVVFLNLLTDIVPKIIVAILGIVKIKLFLEILGQDQLGVYQLYGQILSYLVLAEGGVGTAILYRLFKLSAKGDEKQTNSFMASAKVIFRSITVIMLAIGSIMTFCVPFFIKQSDVSTFFLYSTFFIYMVSEIMTYTTVPERSRFDADQKRYIPNTITQVAQLIRMVTEITLIIITKNLYVILFSILAINIITCIINKIVYKKYYGNINYKVKKDFSVIKECRHLVVNTIANLVSSNIDIILISKFIGLPSVVIYSAYNMIVENIRKIIESFMGATLSSIANIIIKSKTKAYEVLSEYTAFCYYIATILCVPIFISISYFIKIWYNGAIDVSIWLSLLFSLILFLNIIKIPTRTFTFAAGKFKLIKKYVIAETILNLVLSIILINQIGITGVLIATLTSYIMCDFIPKTITVLNNIVSGDKKSFFKDQLFFMAIAILNYLFSILIFQYHPENLITWLLYSVLVFAFCALFTTICYVKTKKLNLKKRLKILKEH